MILMEIWDWSLYGRILRLMNIVRVGSWLLSKVFWYWRIMTIVDACSVKCRVWVSVTVGQWWVLEAASFYFEVLTIVRHDPRGINEFTQVEYRSLMWVMS